jgi:hypothetical protein
VPMVVRSNYVHHRFVYPAISTTKMAAFGQCDLKDTPTRDQKVDVWCAILHQRIGSHILR